MPFTLSKTHKQRFLAPGDRREAVIFQTIRRMKIAVLASSLVISASVVLPTQPADAAPGVVSTHPRLMATDDDFARIQNQRITDPVSASLAQNVINEANSHSTRPIISYTKQDPVRMSATAKELVSRTYALTTAWKLTGQANYIDRLWLDLSAAANFPDWNPAHFLDTAEIAHAFAVGYDWGYEHWNEAQRATLRNAIEQKALLPALTVYEASLSTTPPPAWARETNNRNVVINSGIGMAALSIASDGSAIAPTVLQYAIDSISYGMSGYGADGSYPEGVMYWEYATSYAVAFLHALRTATGTDYGLSATPGLRESGRFIVNMTGPSGSPFTYGDSDLEIRPAAALAGLSRLYSDSQLQAAAAGASATRDSAQRLLWRDAAVSPEAFTSSSDYASDYPVSGVSALRTDPIDSEALFAGFRYGGSPTVGHRHLDGGDFNFQAVGTTWVEQLPKESHSYQLVALDDPTLPARWEYYRLRPEGHNTLVIGTNPATYSIEATGHLVDSARSTSDSFAVADLTALYRPLVTSWQRGIRLSEFGSEMTVQDEISSDRAAPVTWAVHTKAEVLLSPDGLSAILEKDGQRMHMSMTGPAGARFALTDATPFATSPSPPQDSNDAYRKLIVQFEVMGTTALSVTFRPLSFGEDAPLAPPALASLSSWTASPPSTEIADLTIDGVGIEGFDPSRRTYSVLRDPSQPLARVAAFSTDGTPLPVIQPVEGRPTALIRLGAPTSGVLIRFLPGPLAIADVSATRTTRGSPAATIDDNESSGWATSGDQSIEWELEHTTTVRSVRILWSANQTRRIVYEITHRTGGEWAPLIEGEHVGPSGWSEISIPATRASVLRLVVHGDPAGHRDSVVREVEIFGHNKTAVTPPLSKTPFDSVSVTASQTLTLGESGEVSASARLKGRSDIPVVQLVSSDAAVVRVEPDGRVFAVAPGKAVIGGVAAWDGWVAYSKGVVIEVTNPFHVALTPSKDSYVEGGTFTDINYGAARKLDVKPADGSTPASGTRVRNSFLTFDLSGVRPADVGTAVLSLTGAIADEQAGSAIRIDVYETSDEWGEMSVTYRTRPAVGTRVGSFIIKREPGRSSVDLTAFVQSLPAGATTVSVVLGGTLEGEMAYMARFDSRESQNSPVLDLTLTPGPLKIAGVRATSTIRGSAANTTDGVETSGWAGSHDAHVSWSFNTTQLVRSVRLLWSPDASRQVSFILQTRTGTGTWETRKSGAYVGGPGWQDVVFPSAVRADEVQVIVRRVSPDPWQVVVREVGLYQQDVTASPSPVPGRVLGTVGVEGPAALLPNQSAEFSSTTRDSLGAPLSGAQMEWTSTDSTIASVNGQGRVTALRPGRVSIKVTATLAELRASSTIDVSVTNPAHQILPAIADAFVEGGSSATANYGSIPRLDVKPRAPSTPPSGTRVRHSLLKFDASGISSSSIERATIELTGSLIDNGNGDEVAVSLLAVNSSWSEETVTYSSMPALGDLIGIVRVNRTTSRVSVDVTDFLRSLEATDLGLVSFALGGSTTDESESLMTRFYSRENVPSAPTLNLDLAPGGIEMAPPTASYTTRGSAASTVDGNESTGWATSGSQQLTWTFDQPRTIGGAKILWTANSSRVVRFEVQVSDDGVAWRSVHDGVYTGTSGWSASSWSGQARVSWLRIVVHGAPGGDPASVIREVRMYSGAAW